MKEYTVITAAGTGNLIPLVNEKIKEGWQPIGGVCVSSAKTAINELTLFAYQAMVR